MTMKPIAQELLRRDEQVVLESKATKFSGWFISWGRLTLTDQRLIFLNRKGTSIVHSIDRSNIVSVGKGNSFTLIHFLALLVLFAPAVLLLFLIKTVRLTTSGGEVFRYQLPKFSERKKWLTTLSACLALVFLLMFSAPSPVYAQTIHGFRDITFGMHISDAQKVMRRLCSRVLPMHHTSMIQGKGCFSIGGLKRDTLVRTHNYTPEKREFTNIRVVGVEIHLGQYSKQKISVLNEILRKKYGFFASNTNKNDQEVLAYANGQVFVETVNNIVVLSYYSTDRVKPIMDSLGLSAGKELNSSDF